MRKLIPWFAAALVATALVATAPLASASTRSATATATAATYDACQQPLNPDRRSIYRLKNGGDVLSFGRVVVTATKQYYHRYCVQFQTGGRTVYHQWGQAGYERTNGSCVYVGGKGSGAYWTGGYHRTVIVPDKWCTQESYSIRYGGKWYTATFLRYNA
ncbi:MAG: hypothetical protein ACRDTM_17750 [Micromonosporaceae bacterium]